MSENAPAAPLALAVSAEAPPPGLYLVATPIGAARDITLRALDLLNTAPLLAAEDTRSLRHLMGMHGVPLRGRRLIACHEHNEREAAVTVLAALGRGESVAYASEAGTPLVSDPGFRLVQAALAAGFPVHAAPGPSAVLAALTVAGLPTDRFLFAGFPPASGGRGRWLDELLTIDATLVFFESPRRVKQLFKDLCERDPDRVVVMCRELTKRFEEVRRGTAAKLAASADLGELRGEVVVVLDRPTLRAMDEDEVRMRLREALGSGLSARDAARQVAEATGAARREVYRMAIEEGSG